MLKRELKRLYNQDLKCSVQGMAYNYSTHLGHLYMCEGCCCHMTACIELFKRIDPKVTRIETFSGDVLDTCYQLFDGEWQAESY